MSLSSKKIIELCKHVDGLLVEPNPDFNPEISKPDKDVSPF